MIAQAIYKEPPLILIGRNSRGKRRRYFENMVRKMGA